MTGNKTKTPKARKAQRPRRAPTVPPVAVSVPPGPESVRFQDWAHDHGLRRISAGTWASRALGPPERARDVLSPDRKRLVKELVYFHIAEALNDREDPEGTE